MLREHCFHVRDKTQHLTVVVQGPCPEQANLESENQCTYITFAGRVSRATSAASTPRDFSTLHGSMQKPTPATTDSDGGSHPIRSRGRACPEAGYAAIHKELLDCDDPVEYTSGIQSGEVPLRPLSGNRQASAPGYGSRQRPPAGLRKLPSAAASTRNREVPQVSGRSPGFSAGRAPTCKQPPVSRPMQRQRLTVPVPESAPVEYYLGDCTEDSAASASPVQKVAPLDSLQGSTAATPLRSDAMRRCVPASTAGSAPATPSRAGKRSEISDRLAGCVIGSPSRSEVSMAAATPRRHTLRARYGASPGPAGTSSDAGVPQVVSLLADWTSLTAEAATDSSACNTGGMLTCLETCI